MSATYSTESASAEGQQLLNDVVGHLSAAKADLSSLLRTSLHAARLLGWADAVGWLNSEIKGYNNTQVPAHRFARATIEWRPYATNDVIEQVVSSQTKPIERDYIDWPMTAGIDRLVEYAAKGVIVHEEEDDEQWFEISKKMVKGRRVTVVEADAAQRCLDRLQNELFDWASRGYSAVRLGDVVGDIWNDYRSRVDTSLSEIGLSSHLEAITNGLRSSNPQDWRQAAYGVRDVLRDLAKHLWRVEEEVYPFLQNDDKKPIRVTEDKYVNRLWAYLHSKGVTGSTGVYIRSMVRWLHALDDLASKGHEGVTLEEARMIVVGLYSAIGEFVIRTDMKPVTEVTSEGEPANG